MERPPASWLLGSVSIIPLELEAGLHGLATRAAALVAAPRKAAAALWGRRNMGAMRS